LTQQVTARIYELAADIGRLRRRHPGDHILDRTACHIQALALMLEPTASQLANTTAPGDQAAMTEAIRVVDERHRKLQHLLGA
jgi:hypothetical protein